MSDDAKKNIPAEAMAALAERRGTYRLGTNVRNDGWTNDVTGYGTRQDKLTHGYFSRERVLSDRELADLYHHSDLAAKIVDTIPREMLRKPFDVSVKGEDEFSDEVDRKLDKLCFRKRCMQAMQWGRAFGGAALILGCDDGRPSSMPLMPERAKDIDYLHAVDKRYLFPITWYTDPSNPEKMGQPEVYQVMTLGRTTSIGFLHESRLILFGGASTANEEREGNNSFDYSVLQRAYRILRSFDEAWKSVELMLNEKSISVLKIAGLLKAYSAPNGEALVQARASAINFYKSVMRTVVVDAGDADTGVSGEGLERNELTFSGIGDVLDRFIYRICSTAEVPATVLFGMSPGGLNATGESDMRQFYDRTESAQHNEMTPVIQRVTEIWSATEAGRTAGGKPDMHVVVKYAPCWTETPSAKAATRAAIATADKTYIDSGVVLAEEVALARFARPDGFESEISLDDDATKAREESLASELEMMVNPPEPPPGPTLGPDGLPLPPGEVPPGTPPALPPGSPGPKEVPSNAKKTPPEDEDDDE